MSATLTDLYTALKQAVMFSPQYVMPDSGNGKVMKCRQLQTWRVLTKGYGADVKSSNFGATILDKGKPYFWSRAWHESKYSANKIIWDYPALTFGFTQNAIQVERAFQKNTKRCYNFQLAVIDQLVTGCSNCPIDSCENRSINEVYADTEALLFDALYYVSKMRGATLEPSGETGFWNTDYLEYLKTSGIISGYNLGADFGGLLNKESQIAYRFVVEAEKIFGTAIEFQACFHNCEATEFNFNLPDFGVLAAEAGCQTCG